MTENVNVGRAIVRQIANGSRDYFLSSKQFCIGERIRLTAGYGYLNPKTDNDDFVLVEVVEQLRRGHHWHIVVRLEVSGVLNKRPAPVGVQGGLF